MKRKIDEAISKGEETLKADELRKKKLIEKLEQEKEAKIIAELPRAYDWIENKLPKLIEKHVASGRSKLGPMTIWDSPIGEDRIRIRGDVICRASEQVKGISIEKIPRHNRSFKYVINWGLAEDSNVD